MEKLLKKALKKVDEAEIYYEKNDEVLLKSVLDRIESCDSSSSSGYSLRIIKKGRIGFSYFTMPEEFDYALKNAIHASKFSKKLNITFPKKQNYKKIKGLFDKKLEEKTETELGDVLLEMIEVEKRKADPIQNFLTKSIMECCLINSNDCEFKTRTTTMEASSICKFRESETYDFKLSRTFFDPKKTAENAAFYARKFSGAKPITGDFNIIIHPKILTELLLMIFLPAINGERVYRKKSFLAGKIGKLVANEKISFYDDPTIPFGVSSCFCDDEGFPGMKKTLIEKGVLHNFLYDLESSFLAKGEPGNGFRANFAASPSIGVSNLVVESKEKIKFSEVNGVVVHDLIAVHNANPVTGDLAIEIGSGYLIKKGEFVKPVRGCSIIGNFFEILKKIGFLDDFKNYGFYYGPSWIYPGKII